MREVDEALIRAYGLRGPDRPGPGVPPTPHWGARGQTADHPPQPENPARSLVGTPGLAEALDVGTKRSRPTSPALELHWPGLVLMLEREWGARFEQLADRLLEARDRHNLKVLLFTSCHRAEGRTTLVLTLARVLSRRPVRTLVVDADLTGPMLARTLGLRPDLGLEDVVEGGHALADAWIEAPDDKLWILPLRAPVAHPREFLASPGWSIAMARLRREFDMVLIDGSPMFAGLSAAALHRSVDAAILVHNPGTTGERAILRAREVLEAGGVPLLGLAETFV